MNSNINSNQGEIKKSTEHRLTLDSRGALEISGVCEVIAFDESCVSLDTVCGALDIDGTGLTVKDLSVENGKISISGKISGIWYTDKKAKTERRGLFSAKR
ncbi:MAG: sporulation protein YabP [Clostridia bacterium]|nr:sporulation protein YabP [Clostridia bacterium]